MGVINLKSLTISFTRSCIKVLDRVQRYKLWLSVLLGAPRWVIFLFVFSQNDSESLFMPLMAAQKCYRRNPKWSFRTDLWKFLKSFFCVAVSASDYVFDQTRYLGLFLYIEMRKGPCLAKPALAWRFLVATCLSIRAILWTEGVFANSSGAFVSVLIYRLATVASRFVVVQENVLPNLKSLFGPALFKDH